MKRREILRYTAFATGAAISASLVSALLAGCQSEVTEKVVEHQLHFFSNKDFALVKDLADLILPKTDSPAASEVGVPHTMDNMVGRVYLEEDKTAYKKGFTALVNFLKNGAAGKEFIDLATAEKLKILQELNDSKGDVWKEIRAAYLDFRQQTIAYYLTTEEVSTKHLNYLPIPGKYEPCISLEEVGGKVWAI